MRLDLALLLALASLVGQASARDNAIRAVPSSAVILLQGFWTARGDTALGADRLAFVASEHCMFLKSGEARALDLVEDAVYNGAFSRAQIPALTYTLNNSTLFIGLFVASEANLRIGTTAVRVTQRTNYPWSGDVELRIEPEARSTFTVAVRIPSWARGQPAESRLYRFYQPDVPAPTFIVNGETVRATFDRGFARITREWRNGDVIHLYFPMPVHRVLANSSSDAVGHRAALQRGPLLYALEGASNGLRANSIVPLDANVEHSFRPDLFGGVEVLTGPDLLFVPSYALADRSRGVRLVWLRFR